MLAQPKNRITPQDYIRRERAAEFRSEYANGEIFEMAGTSRRHSRAAGNIFASIHAQIRGRNCEAHTNNMRTRITPERYTYPDIVIVCGKPEFEDRELDTLLNPTVIIEVLSGSAASYDRTKKFDSYRLIPSLQSYVLVKQSMPRIERYDRIHNPNVPPERTLWTYFAVTDLTQSIELPAIDSVLALQDVYEGVEFDEEEPEAYSISFKSNC